MTDKYITSSQYEKGLDSIKEYIDKLIPHIEYPVLFTLPADKVLEIYNSTNHAMEFDKPSNIDLNKEIIMTHNNENIPRENSQINYINYQNSNITISFHIGFDINKNTNENKMVITIRYLNTNITSDLVLKQVNHKYLNNKYLKKDVAIQNSITIGTRILGDNIGKYSFSNGNSTTASGYASHSEGDNTVASGDYSHAEGNSTISSSENQHVQGKYNIEDKDNKYAHIVGNGSNNSTRSNAHTLDWNGNAWFAGKLTQEGTPTNDKDLITKKYFDVNKPTVPTKTSELTNDSNFLTEHQSLTNYATIEYVDSKLTTNYVSKEELTESTKPADTTTVKTTLNDILGGDYIE